MHLNPEAAHLMHTKTELEQMHLLHVSISKQAQATTMDLEEVNPITE